MAHAAIPSLDEIRDTANARVPQSALTRLATLSVVLLTAAIGVALMSPDGTRRLAHAWLLSGWFAVSIPLGALFFIGIQLRNSGLTLRQILLNKQGMAIASVIIVTCMIGGVHLL